MKLRTLCLLLVIVSLSACGRVVISPLPSPQPSQLPTEASLPDLVVSSVFLGMQGIPDNYPSCVSAYGPYELRAIIENRGLALAENVTVVEQGTGQQVQVGTLPSMQTLTVQMPLNGASASYTVIVDPQNAVSETDENNNVFSYLAPTPTPPALCPPTQPTPIPTLPPGTPPPLTLDGLIYADMSLAKISKVAPGGVPIQIMNGINARFSPDGLQALFEQSGDLWLAEPMDIPGINITNTPNLLESSPQWWTSNPSRVVFNVVGVDEAQQKGWTHAVAGYAAMINKDGSDYVTLAESPSFTAPAASPDGVTIAYDMVGAPMIYRLREGAQKFDPTLYGYQSAPGKVFTSPSFSSDGYWLTWWVSDDESQPQRNFSLVVFDLLGKSSWTVHSYTALGGTLGWLDAPVWSPGLPWIAFQTRGEATPTDLWLMDGGGSIAQRFGLATNPVWNPDGKHVAFVQWPPRSDSYLSASLSVAEIASWNTEQMSLPAGSIPLAWVRAIPASSSYFPMFTAPSDWLMYSNANPAYMIQYPPDATLDVKPERLTISLSFRMGTQLTEKFIRIETRPTTQQDCYATHPWEGSLQLNGVDMMYRGGKQWEQAANAESVLIGNYATYRSGFCYDIQSTMRTRDDSLITNATALPHPSPADMNFEVLLDIISTFRLQ